MKNFFQTAQEDCDRKDFYVFIYRADELTWRRLFFLPFNIYWRIYIAILGCITFSLVIYEEFFLMEVNKNQGLKDIMMFSTIFYCIDTLMTLMHYLWEAVQKSMPYQKKSFILITVDIFSMLPINSFFSVTLLAKGGIINLYKLWGMNACLRIYRIFLELYYLQQRMDLNPFVLCLVQHNALMLCLSSFLCCIWYAIGHVYTKSWLSFMINNNPTFDATNPMTAYAVSFMHVYMLLNHFYALGIGVNNRPEVIFTTVVVYLGFLLRYCYMLSTMLTSFLKYRGHMYMIKDHIEINMKCAVQTKRKKIQDYYIAYWKNWFGLQRCPLGWLYPLCMRKDIFTDVYWEAIEHSNVLRHFSKNVKREISLVMESSFMQPGEYIYKRGQVQTTFYYIATGVVQVMSHYDGVTPIMTISGGSCIGGLAIVLPTECPTDVRCATECEVRFLTYKSFYKALLKYREATRMVYSTLYSHLSHAKMLYTLSKVTTTESLVMKLYGVPQDDKLKWIKARWRAFSNIDAEHLCAKIPESYLRELKETVLPIEVNHTSKHMDLLVLSREAKWDADKCCLRSTFPYVLDPDCNFIKVWHFGIFIIITLDCLIVPYCVAFLYFTPIFLPIWDQVVCMIYLVDIYCQVVTAVKSFDINITEPTALLRHHLKDMKFIIDLFGTFPLRESHRILFNAENKSANKYSLFRLLKLIRVYTFFNYQCSLITSTMSLNTIKVIYAFVMMTHIFACMAFMLACEFVNDYSVETFCERDSWYVFVPIFSDVESVGKYFFTSLAYVGELFWMSNMDLNNSTSIYNGFFYMLIIIMSRNILSFTMSEFIAIWIMKRRRRLSCLEMITSLKSFLQKRGMHPGLVNMITSYMWLQWDVSHAVKQKFDPISDEILSPMILDEKREQIFLCIKNISFFSSLEPKLLNKLCSNFGIFTIPKDYIFCRSGETPTCFNIIMKGCCNLTSMLKQDVLAQPRGKLIYAGEWFSLLEILQNIPSLQTTASVTTCEVAAINANRLRELLFLNVNMLFDIRAATHFQLYELDVVTSGKRYRRIEQKVPNLLPRLSNKRSESSTTKKSSFNSWFIKLAGLIWNPPFMICPNGSFIYIWEGVKVTQSIISVLYVPSMLLFICYQPLQDLKYVVAFLLDIISILDIYVRFQLAHYHKEGFLINQKSNYLKHSFCMDLISAIPFCILTKNHSFRSKFYISVLSKVPLMYRISGYFFALKVKFGLGDFTLIVSLFCIHFVLDTYVIATCIYAYTCEVMCDVNSYALLCGNVITNDLYKNITTPLSLLLSAAYFTLAMIFGVDSGAFQVNDLHVVKFVVVVSIIGCVVRIVYLSIASAYLTGGQIYFTKHRENIKLLKTFIQHEGGTDAVVADRLINHHMYGFARTNGLNLPKIMKAVHFSIHSDITFALYYKGTKCLQEIVYESKPFLMQLTRIMQEVNYLKDSVILDIDEYNDKLYFISEGVVNVMDDEDQIISRLQPGSMFGALIYNIRLPGVRQKFKYVNEINACLLTVCWVDFFSIFRRHSRRQAELFALSIREKEYIAFTEPTTRFLDRLNEIVTVKSYGILYKGSLLYQTIMFILSIIIPYLTILLLLFTLVETNTQFNIMIAIVYTFDVLSAFRILIGLFATYTDETTGVYVSNLRKIRINYLTSPKVFPLDLISVVPFELFWYALRFELVNVLRLNRLLRVIMIFNYIKECRDSLYFERWMKYFAFFCYITLIPYVMTIVWMILTASDGYAFGDKTFKMPINVFVLSANDVLVLFTLNSAKTFDKPRNDVEALLLIYFTAVCFTVFPFIISSFAQRWSMSDYGRKMYDYKVYCVRLYLQLRDLSNSLLAHLWDYSLFFWATSQGCHFPKYLLQAPPNMKCELMYDLYGGHLKYNVLFETCSPMFVFQLTGRLIRSVYFPGDTIVRKLDVDDRMYFINSGEVEGIEYDDLNVEVVQNVLITGQCFGLAQGLHERLTHMITYKARSTVEILALDRTLCYDLWNAYPDDVRKVYRMADKMDLEDVSL